ncbi:MAG: FAD-dependent oxidoreductase, partial [Synergistaceae bacterium]|nr:FAD-dependent oxidoreductase [Synergistaceae bacterium]
MKLTRLFVFLLTIFTASPAFSYDIIIAGGGMSGVSAAIQAERLSADVLIVEP